MRATSTFVPSVTLLIVVACASAGPSADELNQQSINSTGSTDTSSSSGGAAAMASSVTSSSTTDSAVASVTSDSGTTSAGGTSSTSSTTTGAVADNGATSDTSGMGGTSTTGAASTMGGASSTMDASVTTSSGGVGGVGGAATCTGAYCPRSGSFQMLVYSRTVAFRHDGSIASGKTMLQEIAAEQGFEVTITEDNALITPEGLAQFEVVFFLNPTGDIFNATEEATFEAWVRNDGAFVGTHSATDTESGWPFYKELTGQYYDGHGAANTPGAILFESDATDHPALSGLPNPWQRNEEWYLFNSFQEWASLPGLMILGRKQADNQPIMWAREYDNYRSFYTAIGHDAVVFEDPDVKKHITGAIMWAVRREHLIQ